MKNKSIWIGLVHIQPVNGNMELEGAIGAYVHVLLYANNPKDYEKQARETLVSFDYRVLEVEDIELFNSNDDSFDEELRQNAALIDEENPFQWGTFYTYDNEEE